MTIQTLPRTLVAGAIKVVRLPADLALAYTGDGAFATSAGVAVDRVDAAVRGAAGTVLRDDQLRRDADRRREAAGERARALRLRTEAEKRTDLGEELAEEAAETEEKIEDEAKAERAEVLEAQSEALEERDEALAAADEARRLKEAAERVKEERKAEDAKTGRSGDGDRGVNGGSTSTPVSRSSGGSLDRDG